MGLELGPGIVSGTGTITLRGWLAGDPDQLSDNGLARQDLTWRKLGGVVHDRRQHRTGGPL